MIWLTRLTIGGVALGAALVGGCASTGPQITLPEPPRPVAGTQVAEFLPAPPSPSGSPYHAVLSPAQAVAKVADKPNSPSGRSALLPPSPELTVRPVTPKGASAAPRDVVQVASHPTTLPDLQPKPLPDPPLVAALRCYLDCRPYEAVSWLGHFEKPNQEVLLGLLPLTVRLSEGNLDKATPQEISALLAQHDSLAGPLRRRAPLVIDKACFTKRIDGFGSYEPLPHDWAFRLGDQVEVYAELRNFTCAVHGLAFVTRFGCSVEIRDFNDQVRWAKSFEDRSLSSRSEKHDLHHRCYFPLPSLPPGDYILRLRVTDVPTGRSAQRSLDFRVTTMPNRPS